MWTETITTGLYDTDGLGHVSNVTSAIWFERARNGVFRLFTPDLSIKLGEWKLIMAKTEYEFVGEVFFGPDVEIRTWVDRIGKSSFTTYHEVWQNGQIAIKSKATMVNFDFKKKISVEIPADIRGKLEEHLPES